MTKTKTTENESSTAVPPAGFATKEQLDAEKAAKAARRAEIEARQAAALKGHQWNPRSAGLLPHLPDRDMLPHVDDVLGAYDKASKIIARARELQDRRTQLPSLIKAAEASYVDAAERATTESKALPKLDEITDLKAELDTIDASMRGIEKAAWTAFKDWGYATRPHMAKLIEPACDELDDALSALGAASAAVDWEIERISQARSVLAWARNDEFRPNYTKTNEPALVEASSKLSDGLSRVTSYAKRVREEV